MRLRQLLGEIFDQGYKLNTIKHDGGWTEAKFKDENNSNFHIWAHHNDLLARSSVGFERDGNENLGGGSLSKANKVMTTVHNVIKQHLHQYPNSKSLYFDGAEEEPSRIKLYHHLAFRLSPNYQYQSNRGYTHFKIDRKDMKL